MQVKDLMNSKPLETITIEPSANILRAMQLLIENGISCLPVLDENDRLIGIVSDKDIFRAVFNNQDSFVVLKVSDLMTREIIVGLEGDDVNYIAGLMTNNRIRHIPIVEEDRLVGLISIGDVVKAQFQKIEIENRYLQRFIDGTYPG